jgi:hypothetical protein
VAVLARTRQGEANTHRRDAERKTDGARYALSGRCGDKTAAPNFFLACSRFPLDSDSNGAMLSALECSGKLVFAVDKVMMPHNNVQETHALEGGRCGPLGQV